MGLQQLSPVPRTLVLKAAAPQCIAVLGEPVGCLQCVQSHHKEVQGLNETQEDKPKRIRSHQRRPLQPPIQTEEGEIPGHISAGQTVLEAEGGVHTPGRCGAHP